MKFPRNSRILRSQLDFAPFAAFFFLLVIFVMLGAFITTPGVPLQLPKTEAGAMQDQQEPLTVSVRANGEIFLNETQVPFASLAPAMRDMAGQGFSKPVYVRADGRAPYAIVAQVMAALSSSGFSSINLITDTGGPSSGPAASGAPAGKADHPVAATP